MTLLLLIMCMYIGAVGMVTHLIAAPNTYQGVWNQVDGFTMTDPVIHHVSSSKMYGKTDKGKAGIKEFFATHKCNPICRQLGLDPSPRV